MSVTDTPVGIAAETIRYKRRIRPSWIVSAVLALYVVLLFVDVLSSSSSLRWDTVASYLFAPDILSGVGKTLLLTVVSMAIAVVFGVVLALMRTASDPTLRAVAWAYVGFMRSVPLIVLILFVYFLAVLLPNLTIGLPFGGPQLASWDTNEIITPFTAAIIALGFGEAAYTSEIIRGGLLAVSRGQSEAATALGMPPGMIFARVTLPQAFRVIVPGLGNEAIGMLKATALVQIIGYTELLTTAQRIYAVNFQTIPLLLVVTAWYLVLTIIGTVMQSFLEKRMNRAY